MMKVEAVDEALDRRRLLARARAASGRGVASAPRPSSASTTAGSRPRTWPSATRSTSTAPRSRTSTSRASARPARRRCASTTRSFEEHGWQSTAHRRRDRHRRHAVPHRLGEHGAEPARLRRPPDHPPGRRACAATTRASCSRSSAQPRDGRQGALGRVGHPRRGRPPDRPAPSSTQLERHLERVIGEVRAAVEDWPAMRSAGARRRRGASSDAAAAIEAEEVDEASAFLELARGRQLHLPRLPRVRARRRGRRRCWPRCRHRARHPAPGRRRTSRRLRQLPPAVRARALEPYLLNLTKANSRATVHRPSYLDYVGVKRFDADGDVIGERRFLGLYTHTAYRASPTRDPDPAAQGRRRPRARRPSRTAATTRRRCVEILETYPRDELFQISVDELFEIAMGILHLGERQRLRLFVRRDTFGRFFSCLVFVPRDRFNTENRRRIEAILREALRRRAASTTRRACPSRCSCASTSWSTCEPGAAAGLRRRARSRSLLVAATRSWADDLEEALIEEHGEERGNALYRRYARRLPGRLPRGLGGPLGAGRHRAHRGAARARRPRHQPLPPARGGAAARCARSCSAPGAPLTLSDVLPLFENMGVRGRRRAALRDQPARRRRRRLDLRLRPRPTRARATSTPTASARRFQDAFVRAWRGEVENDGYNRLVLGAGLDLARDHGAARDRQVPAPGAASRSATATWSRRCVAHPRDRAAARRAVPARASTRAGDRRARTPSDGRASAIEERDRRGREPRPGPDPAQLPRRRPGDAAHELLPDGTERQRKPLPVVQARPVGAALAARSRARASRSSSTRRASEGVHLRGGPGRARRHPLVGPPRGLPHRGARPDEGADGQERGDRARSARRAASW